MLALELMLVRDFFLQTNIEETNGLWHLFVSRCIYTTPPFKNPPHFVAGTGLGGAGAADAGTSFFSANEH